MFIYYPKNVWNPCIFVHSSPVDLYPLEKEYQFQRKKDTEKHKSLTIKRTLSQKNLHWLKVLVPGSFNGQTLILSGSFCRCCGRSTKWSWKNKNLTIKRTNHLPTIVIYHISNKKLTIVWDDFLGTSFSLPHLWENRYWKA